ncbi:hypothetical protein D3C81_2236260 [compost metagenome]
MATTVVLVDFHRRPGVFVEVHVALGVDVSLTRLEGALHFPHPVQLVAGQVLVDVTGLDDVVVLEFW